MSEPNEVIPVFFTIDDGFAPFLGVALHSIVQNASKARRYKVIVLHQGISEGNKRKLEALLTENFEIEFVPMEDGLGSIADRMNNRLRADFFTLTIFFRLFIPAMFPEYEKGIYLDSDIVVPGDISELYDVELYGNLLGAAVDPVVVHIPEFRRHARDRVGVECHQYFNSGVLLMNLEKLREVDLDRRFLELLNRYHFDCIAPDQDYLNAMCFGKVTYLPATWDAMPSDFVVPMPHPDLIHYNLFGKPWHYDDIQYGRFFWEYADSSGYLSEIMDIKANFKDSLKKADQDHLGLLITRAGSIGDEDVTFRKVFNEGRESRL
jgi:Lipopolysaccharide biosynthesis proteins, LPS:glycosyltransferases